jgi:hypothetical protein
MKNRIEFRKFLRKNNCHQSLRRHIRNTLGISMRKCMKHTPMDEWTDMLPWFDEHGAHFWCRIKDEWGAICEQKDKE